MFGFNFNIEMIEAILEVYIGETLAESQQLQAPQFVVEQQFKQLMTQIMDDTRPMKIRLCRDEPIYDEMNNYIRTLQNYVEYENKALTNG